MPAPSAYRLGWSFGISALLHLLILMVFSQFWTPVVIVRPAPQLTVMEVSLLPPIPKVSQPILKPQPPKAAVVQRATPLPPYHHAARRFNAVKMSGHAGFTAPHLATPKAALVQPVQEIASPKIVTSALPKQPDQPDQIATATNQGAPPALVDSHTGGASSGQGESIGTGNGAGLGTGAGNGTGTAGPFGTSTQPGGGAGVRHIVYVLDISLSMPSRIDRAKQELRDSLKTLQPGETFDVIAFDERTFPFNPTLLPANDQTIADANMYLDHLRLGPGTNLEGAISTALDMTGVNVVTVITDGVPTVGETDNDKLARYIQYINTSHARIYTIGLVGKDPDGVDQTFPATKLLQTLAHDSGGESKIVTLGDVTPD